ncbi:hypothetical protein SAMN02745823_01810 [Sporobacter termitidis DSM 10068]|uniref:DUF2383 domain-containing protein n=1 Tax=Sporobacter termitidis DSM 10068 TaxID=1123282 RepID=A0A1M5XHE6_9FIRM|nr:hypothetical protein [Sporobacter termitidis]SHH99052.1 hypothetical protein SAMN02745823_01810 [Sporobacter termitidis DSM 10068]
MSCSSIKHRFDQLQASGGIDFNAAVSLYNELKGSLDAHRLELSELQQTGDSAQLSHLQQHIKDGEDMLSSLQKMSLH